MSKSLEARLSRVEFSMLKAGADRVHVVNPEDVRVVLSRLPLELWNRLRAVHFNDRSRGARTLGYVNQGRREIAMRTPSPNEPKPVFGQRTEPDAIRSETWQPMATAGHSPVPALRC